MSDERLWNGAFLRPSAKGMRWKYTQVGVVGRYLKRKHFCVRCRKPEHELFKRFVDGGGSYGPLYVDDKFAYCLECINTLWTLDDLRDLVDGDKKDG